MPVVTRPSEGTRPEPTSAMVTRSRAREGRGISVAPEAQITPEIEMRPEQEKATCDGWEPLDHSQPTLVVCLHFAEIVTAHTSQEVTETSVFSAAQSQTSLPHNNIPLNTSCTILTRYS